MGLKTKEDGIWGICERLTSGASRKIVVMGLILSAANQLSGINAIIYYAKQVFEHIVSVEQALVNTYYLGLLQVGVTLVSGFMINNYGRRTLMLLGSSIVVGSLLLAYIFDSFVSHSEKVVIALIFLHIVGFSLSLGPITFIYAAELMENVSFVLIINWVLTILVSLVSEIMIKAIGIGKVFLFFGVCSLGCLLYFYRNMIESAGLSRQELVCKFEKAGGYKSLADERVDS